MVSKYLFIGAHPDDIEFGAGATLAKAIRLGIECHTLVLSNCQESLPYESEIDTLILESMEALKLLGVHEGHMVWERFPVRKFEEFRSTILQFLIDKYRISHWDRVYIPSKNDVHQDHSVVSQETLRALKFSTILGYELPWNNFESDVSFYNSINPLDSQRKLAAISKFKSQKNRFYSSPEKIETVLNFRGLQINVTQAEAFEVLRWIEH
jgi:LmbE family N-acetylglucosaminyl deacetylase